MSAANYLLTEEQLWCCICLDVFTDPVTLPCGHNFCRSCIIQHLNTDPQRQCPLCKEPVEKKYKLGVNTFISEMAVQFRQSAGKKPIKAPHQHDVTPRRLSQDAPAGPKHQFLKLYLLLALSLTCLILFFAANLNFYQTVSSWKSHQLLGSVGEAAESMCTEHDKPLQLYCKLEQRPICQSCAASHHRYHQVVLLEDEYKEKQTILGSTEAKIQEMIWQRQLKLKELKHSVELSEEVMDGKMADGVQIFTTLIQFLEKAQVDLIRMAEEKQRVRKQRAQSIIVELEQEIFQLMRRRVEVEQLLQCKDRLHFLQSFPSVNAAPPTRDWMDLNICPVRYEALTRTAMISAVNQMTELVRNEMKKLQDEEILDIRKYAAEVTLDSETAHPALVLSDDGKQVHCGEAWKTPAKNLKRLKPVIYVLGKQSFSCGRFHYDVQVKGKTDWTIGVAKGSVKRKEETELNPENGYWALHLRDGNEYIALGSRAIPLSVNYHLEKVRIFVDYEEGVVSFYDADAAILLYSFPECSFTETLYPFLSPGNCDGGRNSDPLIILTANTT